MNEVQPETVDMVEKTREAGADIRRRMGG